MWLNKLIIINIKSSHRQVVTFFLFELVAHFAAFLERIRQIAQQR